MSTTKYSKTNVVIASYSYECVWKIPKEYEDLNDKTKVEWWGVKWDTLTIKPVNGELIELTPDYDGEDSDYAKHPTYTLDPYDSWDQYLDDDDEDEDEDEDNKDKPFNVDDVDAPNIYPYKECKSCGERKSCGNYDSDMRWYCEDCYQDDDEKQIYTCEECKDNIDYNMTDQGSGICLDCMKCGDCGCECPIPEDKE